MKLIMKKQARQDNPELSTEDHISKLYELLANGANMLKESNKTVSRLTK